jgi:hypothetical protein
MRFLAMLLVLTFLGCAKDTPPPPPGVAHQKTKQGQKAAEEKENNTDTSNASVNGEKIDKINRSNPFLTVEEEKTFGAKSREALTTSRISGIFSSVNGAYAIVDGKVLKVSDRIYGKEVVEINHDNVVLKDSSREYIITLGAQ